MCTLLPRFLLPSLSFRHALLQWAHQESNLGPSGYEPVALPTELWAPKRIIDHGSITVKVAQRRRVEPLEERTNLSPKASKSLLCPSQPVQCMGHTHRGENSRRRDKVFGRTSSIPGPVR